jgi:hypothetical protein
MKNAFAQRDFTIGDRAVEKGEDLSSLPRNQVRDFQIVGLLGPDPSPAAASTDITETPPSGKAKP